MQRVREFCLCWSKFLSAENLELRISGTVCDAVFVSVHPVASHVTLDRRYSQCALHVKLSTGLPHTKSSSMCLDVFQKRKTLILT